MSTHITLCLQLNLSVDHHSQGKSLYLCTVDNFRVFVSDTPRILTIFSAMLHSYQVLSAHYDL